MRNHNLVIKDTEALKKEALDNKIKKHHDEKVGWLKQQLAHCVYIENENEDPSNIPQQLGQMMTAKDFEDKLIKLIPNLKFEYNPVNPKMKALYHIKGEKKEYICSYHADIMPEHSIIKIKKELVWDPDQKILKRSELPKHQWVAGKGYVFEGIPPGWKEVKVPWGELKRGWRTVLIKLVKEGLLTIPQAESFNGSPTSQFGQRAWAYHLGKREGSEVAIPF